MNGQEYEIKGRLLGGYSKKSVDTYTKELQKELQETRDELSKEKGEKQRLEEKLKEAEGCYRSLWERSKGQEATIAQQKETMQQQKETIEQQHEMLKLLAKKNQNDPLQKAGGAIQKQMEKIISLVEQKTKGGRKS